ncbi:hypothetical protein B0T21DRAFT_354156, partial [Apiosordaria backusii]
MAPRGMVKTSMFTRVIYVSCTMRCIFGQWRWYGGVVFSAEYGISKTRAWVHTYRQAATLIYGAGAITAVITSLSILKMRLKSYLRHNL